MTFMNRLTLAAALILLALYGPAKADPTKTDETLWSIGQTDQSSADLALGINHPDREFIHKFPRDPFFVIGKSDPAQDWPGIQPGPRDTWGNRQTHTFSI